MRKSEAATIRAGSGWTSTWPDFFDCRRTHNPHWAEEQVAHMAVPERP